ncbi:MAG TPA: SUMF1/EgtB/PvdO family nonheme iron enzyme [Terriglobales bacterium]|nr:SUMF1/EgtB/PvdO family nonheme iron enzyme [Terriglobales bacterium]
MAQARAETDKLLEFVKPDSLYARPIPERHRIVFYIGHLEAFDWNLLLERVINAQIFNPQFDRLFAFGIDPVDGGLPSDQPADWPSIPEVQKYVRRIRESLDKRLAAISPSDSAGDGFSASTLINVAIEHRLMHAETLAYMLHQLPLEAKIPPASQSQAVASRVNPAMIEIPAGRATLGLSRGSGRFGWDNEFEEHSVEVPAFAIDKYKITNREYLEFLTSEGYENEEYWTEADWDWKTKENITHPVFWHRMNGDWLLRTMFHEIPLPPDWPVYVSHAEASAYARWAGKQLPTEAQWHRAAYGTREGKENPYPWGSAAPDEKLGNFNFERWDPTPVGAFPDAQSAFGMADLLGNGWEWTSSIFAPFAGFEPFPFYRGYSADFFDGKHFAMKGGSPRTAACMLRRSFRNWFQPHYQYVYAGFRCVSN